MASFFDLPGADWHWSARLLTLTTPAPGVGVWRVPPAHADRNLRIRGPFSRQHGGESAGGDGVLTSRQGQDVRVAFLGGDPIGLSSAAGGAKRSSLNARACNVWPGTRRPVKNESPTERSKFSQPRGPLASLARGDREPHRLGECLRCRWIDQYP